MQNEASYPIDQRPGGWYDWFTRREFHDDHAAFFASDFTGRQEIFYMIRVVNPGTFQISPARVQPMYQHGVEATSDSLPLACPASHAAGRRSAMTMKPPPIWRDALALLSVRLVLAQLGLVTGVFLLFMLWLRLPDASTLEVAASALLALLIVAGAGWERAGDPRSRRPPAHAGQIHPRHAVIARGRCALVCLERLAHAHKQQ